MNLEVGEANWEVGEMNKGHVHIRLIFEEVRTEWFRATGRRLSTHALML